jgi:tmRNA-binding protein
MDRYAVWRHGLIGRPEPMRVRKLLANRSELKKMEAFMSHPNAQLVRPLPLSMTMRVLVVVASNVLRSLVCGML